MDKLHQDEVSLNDYSANRLREVQLWSLRDPNRLKQGWEELCASFSALVDLIEGIKTFLTSDEFLLALRDALGKVIEALGVIQLALLVASAICAVVPGLQGAAVFLATLVIAIEAVTIAFSVAKFALGARLHYRGKISAGEFAMDGVGLILEVIPGPSVKTLAKAGGRVLKVLARGADEAVEVVDDVIKLPRHGSFADAADDVAEGMDELAEGISKFRAPTGGDGKVVADDVVKGAGGYGLGEVGDRLFPGDNMAELEAGLSDAWARDVAPEANRFKRQMSPYVDGMFRAVGQPIEPIHPFGGDWLTRKALDSIDDPCADGTWPVLVPLGL